MSTPTAKDLLAQADRLMKQRTPEELPVLTDLVIEEIEITGTTERMDTRGAVPSRPAWMLPPTPIAPAPPASPALPALFRDAKPELPGAFGAVPEQAAAAPAASAFVPARPLPEATDVLGVLPQMTQDSLTPASVAMAGGATANTASVRDQFNAQLLAKVEEMQHGVYSQVMQQLEIYASGSLKSHLRETLLPALTDIARDIAEQVAEDTATQVREVVSKAVDSEIARLREQLSKRRN